MYLKIKKCLRYLLIFLFLTGIISCKKYLDEKPNKSDAIPDNLTSLQAILDFYPHMNNENPSAGEVSSDDYYLTYPNWTTRKEPDRRMYMWANDHMFEPSFNDWQAAYQVIYKANTVLDNIVKDPRNESGWNNIKGQALLFRAKSFFQIASIWCKVYDPNTASTDPGISLRLTSNFNEVSVRASVQESYDRIIQDLEESYKLLPVTPVHVMRPSRPAAFGLLARVYLSMGKYDKAKMNADSCLQIKDELMDYNNSPYITQGSPFPFAQFNPEVIFESVIVPSSPLSASRAKIDSNLYNSYDPNDLRKTLFFKANTGISAGTFAFKGMYESDGGLFNGISTNEIYLIRAEANAKLGNKDAAMADLNLLLIKRWKTNTFFPFTAVDANDALNKIRIERRKELVMRGLRWMDLKRYNREGANITITRNLNGQIHLLLPNDLKYALPIPEDVIALSGIPQNPR